MDYDIKKLSEVEALPEVPEGANMIAEVGGQIKRVPAVAGGSGGSGGENEVYTVKKIMEITEEGEKVTTEGTLQEAIAAYKQGKTLRMATVFRFDGNEIVTDETIHCYVGPHDSYVIFYLLHSNGKGVDILRQKFTADGFADELGIGETVLNSLYVTSGVHFFLHSSTAGSNKFFRVKVDDSGSLSTEDVGEIE